MLRCLIFLDDHLTPSWHLFFVQGVGLYARLNILINMQVLFVRQSRTTQIIHFNL